MGKMTPAELKAEVGKFDDAAAIHLHGSEARVRKEWLSQLDDEEKNDLLSGYWKVLNQYFKDHT